jgi:flagellar motility protein MotE (MotC chaperone)
MVFAVSRHAVVGAIVLVGLLAGSAVAQNDGKPKPVAPPQPDKNVENGVSRYCANVAPIAAEARIAWETRRLNELDAQIKERVAELEKTEAETRDWVSKRDALLNAASDDVVAIYGKMDPEAAAAQIAAMDEPIAVSILHKLKVGAASAILDQMDAARAARLTSLILAATPPEKKS